MPTLTKKELNHLLSGEEPTQEIYEKAESYARERKKNGKSPFAQQDELRVPVPQKKGGAVHVASKRADGIAQRGKTRCRMR